MITDLSARLGRIEAQGLHRRPRYLSSAQGPRVILEGRECLLLSSNSYLGLCGDERLKQAAREAIDRYGVGSGGSRLTTGSYDLAERLETALAAFKGTEAAVVFNTGYMANVGTLSALAGPGQVIFSDRLNHASIIDGCRLSGAQVIVYEHCDAQDLERKVRGCPVRPGLVVTDGLFSVDGDIAPLPEIVAVARRHGLAVMVDDAHATGVLGPHGGGTVELFGLQAAIEIQMGTLSKALAGEGGFVAGKRVLIDYLMNSARSFIFSTAMAPAGLAVALEALEIVRREPERRRILHDHAVEFRAALRRLGFQVLPGETPLIAVILGDPDRAVRFSSQLLEKGIYVTAIRPPTVPPGTSRLRINLMATHTRADLEEALERMGEVGRAMGILPGTPVSSGDGRTREET
jgi:8-amino-7-oxononanoate synthase